MKNKPLLALLTLPLAILGFVGSVALAANRAQPSVTSTSMINQHNTPDPQDSDRSEAEDGQATGGKEKVTTDRTKNTEHPDEAINDDRLSHDNETNNDEQADLETNDDNGARDQ